MATYPPAEKKSYVRRSSRTVSPFGSVQDRSQWSASYRRIFDSFPQYDFLSQFQRNDERILDTWNRGETINSDYAVINKTLSLPKTAPPSILRRDSSGSEISPRSQKRVSLCDENGRTLERFRESEREREKEISLGKALNNEQVYAYLRDVVRNEFTVGGPTHCDVIEEKTPNKDTFEKTLRISSNDKKIYVSLQHLISISDKSARDREAPEKTDSLHRNRNVVRRLDSNTTSSMSSLSTKSSVMEELKSVQNLLQLDSKNMVSTNTTRETEPSEGETPSPKSCTTSPLNHSQSTSWKVDKQRDERSRMEERYRQSANTLTRNERSLDEKRGRSSENTLQREERVGQSERDRGETQWGTETRRHAENTLTRNERALDEKRGRSLENTLPREERRLEKGDEERYWGTETRRQAENTLTRANFDPNQPELINVVREKVETGKQLDWADLFILKSFHYTTVQPIERDLFLLFGMKENEEVREKIDSLRDALEREYLAYQRTLHGVNLLPSPYTLLAHSICVADSYWFHARIVPQTGRQQDLYRNAIDRYTDLLDRAESSMSPDDAPLLRIVEKISRILVESRNFDPALVMKTSILVENAERKLDGRPEADARRQLQHIKHNLATLNQHCHVAV